VSFPNAATAIELDAARWRAVLTTARDAIIAIDPEGIVTIFNRAAEEIFGFLAEDVLGRNVSMLMPSPYREEHDGYLRAYRETGQARAIGRIREVQGRRKSGEVFPIELSVSEARVGDEVLYTAVVRDVSERARLQLNLDSRLRQQQAVSELGVVAAREDVPVLLQEVARVVAETLDVELCGVQELLPVRAELILRAGIGWSTGTVGTALVPASEDSLAGYTLSAGEPVVIYDLAREPRMRDPQLLERHGVVSVSSVVLRCAGRAWGVLGAYARRPRRFDGDDVNFLQSVANLVGAAISRRKIEEELAVERDYAEGLVDTAHAIVLVLDATTRIVRFNRYTAELTGYSEDQVAGQSWIDKFVPPREQERVRARIGDAMRGDRLRGIVYPILTKDAREIEIEWYDAPYRDPSGGFVGLLAVGHDVTSRREAERELLRLRQLSQQRQRMADVGALTTKIVHDLANPLAALSMVSQGILKRIDRSPDEPAANSRPQAERLVSTVKRLDALLGEFKDFVREQRLALQDIEVGAFLGSLEQLWRDEAESRNAALEIRSPSQPLSIRADPEKLHRVFDNLVKNALEAIDSESGRVEIEVEPRCDSSVRISVRDTGPGIPAGLDIFALFETTKADGTGLGLPICREIVLAHGGAITHDRNDPHGAVFHVDLPLRGPSLA